MNQQKVIFARALLAKPKLLICDEPTRGVDVGAKAEIFALLRQLAANGVAIILISSEFPELLALCPRLAVVRHGRIQAVIANTNLDEHRLTEIVAGAVDIACPDFLWLDSETSTGEPFAVGN